MVIPVNAASEEDIETSIVNGLAWLAAQQQVSGQFGDYEPVAHTGLAVLKFINRAVETGEYPFGEDYEYSAQIISGLNYLFTNGHVMPISVQPNGDPDSDGDGNGVYFESPGGLHHRTYSTGISLMAIGAAADYDGARTVSIGPLSGWTYLDVVQDTVDYVAFGQNDNGNERGGWGLF